MTGAEFILSLVAALAWPAAFLFLALVLRADLKRYLER